LQAVTASRALLNWLNAPQPPLDGEALPIPEDTTFLVEELRRRLRAVIATEEPLSSVLLELNVSQQHTRQIQGQAQSLIEHVGHPEGRVPRLAGTASLTEQDETSRKDL